jgi:hypothetical protein
MVLPDVSRKRKENQMNIKKISRHFNTSKTVGDLIPSLTKAFIPFGSLTQGVDGMKLATAMVAWVDASTKEQPQLAQGILQLLWSSNTEEFSKVEFSTFEITLRTPTSGTKIRLRRYAGGYFLEVDFGAGSFTRAMTILRASEVEGLRFNAYNDSEISWGDLLEELEGEARRHLSWLENLEPGYYNSDLHERMLVKARAEVESYEF